MGYLQLSTMAPSLLRLVAALIFTIPALANPTKLVKTRQTCQDQSCIIAALSGSSGETYDPATPPTGGTFEGDCCIISYNPSVADILYEEESGLEAYCEAESKKHKRAALSPEKRAEIQARDCLPYTLIFSKGTLEIGDLGDTVGPALELGLDLAAPGEWTVMGVDYENTIDGDYCLGLPGGVVAAEVLESVVSSCPDTKIIMSGYSEGAMVTHNVSPNRRIAFHNRHVIFRSNQHSLFRPSPSPV